MIEWSIFKFKARRSIRNATLFSLWSKVPHHFPCFCWDLEYVKLERADNLPRMSSSEKFKEKMIEMYILLVLFIQKRKKIMGLVSIWMAHPPYVFFFQNVNDDSRWSTTVFLTMRTSCSSTYGSWVPNSDSFY